MSEKKPTPILNERTGLVCPVCGKKSYSRGGVHPQCSMVLADAPRKMRLAAEKKAEEKKKLAAAERTAHEPLIAALPGK